MPCQHAKNTVFLLVIIQIWIEFLRGDITRKATFYQGTSLECVCLPSNFSLFQTFPQKPWSDAWSMVDYHIGDGWNKTYI